MTYITVKRTNIFVSPNLLCCKNPILSKFLNIDYTCTICAIAQSSSYCFTVLPVDQ